MSVECGVTLAIDFVYKDYVVAEASAWSCRLLRLDDLAIVWSFDVAWLMWRPDVRAVVVLLYFCDGVDTHTHKRGGFEVLA